MSSVSQSQCAACGATVGLVEFKASGGPQKIIHLCADKIACDLRSEAKSK